MVKIILEDWQVKNLREYFGHNDKTQTSHWAYDVFNKAYKEQCNIPIVVSSNKVDYKKGFELAQNYINESPCDPDIYQTQQDAWNDYQQFLIGNNIT